MIDQWLVSDDQPSIYHKNATTFLKDKIKQNYISKCWLNKKGPIKHVNIVELCIWKGKTLKAATI